MRKKFLAILFSTLMSATFFGSITVLADDEIPEDAEIPTTLPVNIVDDQDGATHSWDLYMDDYYLYREKEQGYSWHIYYQIWNYGDNDLTGVAFYDKAWLWLGYWDPIADSQINHNSSFFLGAGDHKPFDYSFEAPQGWHPFSQWTDAGDTVDELSETNNDCPKYLWSW